MEALAGHFEKIVICCPFTLPATMRQSSIYSNKHISFIQLPLAGGNGFKGNMSLLKALPAWYKAFKKMNAWADIVYQRFPNNLNLPGFLYFYLHRKKGFATYTGAWYNYKGEPATYRLQKLLLKSLYRGPVGIYFDEKDKYKHIFKTFSPSYTDHEWQQETDIAKRKKKRFLTGIYHIPIYISVGKLTPKKNHLFLLECFKTVHEEGVDFRLYIIGDGPMFNANSDFIKENGLANKIIMSGNKDYDELKNAYREADFLVHPSLAEGYVKVPVEGFFCGVIPLINNISIAGEITGVREERGFLFSAEDKASLVQLIKETIRPDARLADKIEEGRKYSFTKTMEAWEEQFLTKVFSFYNEL